MAAIAQTFEWYDAWVLAAVICASEKESPVPLWRVIGTADALNKAVVTREELELAIGRLADAGWLRVVDEGFEPSPAALELKQLGDPVENVRVAIDARESSQSDQAQTAREWFVSAEAYEQAVRTFQEEFLNEMRALRRLRMKRREERS